MPCDAVRVFSIELAAADKRLLEKTCNVLGLTLSENQIYGVERPWDRITLADGKASCSQTMLPVVNRLRVEYAKQAVGAAALKYGWQKVQAGPNRLTLKKGV